TNWLRFGPKGLASGGENRLCAGRGGRKTAPEPCYSGPSCRHGDFLMLLRAIVALILVSTSTALPQPAPAAPPLPVPRPDPAAPPAPAARPAASSDVRDSVCLMIESAARANELPLEFFARVIWQESRFRPDVVGPVTRSGQRAQGIAQFMPGT